MPINDPSCATLPPLEIRRPEKVVTTKGGGYTTQLLLLDQKLSTSRRRRVRVESRVIEQKIIRGDF